MRGVVVVNGYYFSDASRHQSERVAEEGKKLGVEISVYQNDRPYAGRELPAEIKAADFCLFFDKDLVLARAIENAGVPLLNAAGAIEIADDKALTAVFLDGKKIPTPLTFPAPKRYDGKVDEAFLSSVGEKLGYPVIVKESAGSLGAQVYLAKDFASLVALDQKLADKPRLYQRFIEGSRGKSYRVIVVGGKVLLAMQLVNSADFRSNAAKGGKATPVELPDDYLSLAERTAQETGLRYCGVDLFCDAPSVIEVNSNAYFLTAERTTGKNVARAIVEEAIKLAKG